MATRETLDLLLKLDVQGDGQLKSMANDADKAAQRLQELAQKTDLTTRTMATQQRELAALQQQYANTAGKATDLADKLDRVVAAEGKNSAAATRLQSELDRTATAAQKVAIAIEKKEIALQRGSNALQKIATEAQQTGTALQSEAAAATKSAQAHLQLSRDSEGAGSAFTGMATKLSGLAAGFLGLSAIAGKAAEGFQLGAELDQSRRTLGILLGDVEKGNKVYAEAIAFGQKYGFTQKEMASSAAAAAGIIKNTNQTVEQTLGVLARLASLNPVEGIEGATFALKELASGDIMSLVERFNMSKTAANEMKQAIAEGADPVLVLDKALSGLGVSASVLSERMEGQNGGLLRMKLATEQTVLSMGQLLEAFGATYILEAFAAGLGTIATGIQNIATGVTNFFNQDAMFTTALTEGTARMMERGASFSEYAARMESVGQSANALTEAEYNAAQAMIAHGTAANDAITASQTLSDTQAVLVDALTNVALSSGMSEEAQAALIERTMQLADDSPAAAAAVAELTEELSNTQDVEAFTAVLDVQTAALAATAENHEFATSTAFGYADAQLAAADATDVTTGSIYDVTDATYEQTSAGLEAAIAAENQSRFQEDLAWAVAMSGDSAFGAAGASAFLVNAYGLEADQVATLIALTNELNNARAGKQGNALARAAGARARQITNPDTGGAAGYHQRSVDRAERRERAGGGGRSRGGGGSGRSGGGAGKKAGKSEEVKQAEKTARELDKIEERVEKAKTDYQRKVEDAAKKHADKLQAIDEEYFAKNLEATNKFNADKFDTQLSFLEAISKVDQEFWDAARAAEDAYWQESQALAQAGHAEQAAALYEAGQEEARIKAENAQQMKDLRQQIAEEENAAERAKLEQQLARQAEINAREEQLASDKVKKIREGGDQLEQERADAIAKENEDYSAAQDTLKADFQETLTDIKTSYADMGAAARELADGIIAAAQAATAAVNAIPMPSASGAPADAAPVGSYATGTGDRGLPRTGMFEGHAGEIILNRTQSDALRSVGGTRAVDSLNRIAAPLAGARTPSVGTAGSVSNSSSVQVNAPITIPAGANVRAADIQAAVAAGIEEGILRANRQIGGRADSRKKLGY